MIASLIARLEAATGPDRELDLDLWWACKANNPTGAPMDADYKALNLAMNDAPRYTASIDAAQTLVPEGMKWSVGSWSDNFATVGKDSLGKDAVNICIEPAPSPPIALCIAALKARGVG